MHSAKENGVRSGSLQCSEPWRSRQIPSYSMSPDPVAKTVVLCPRERPAGAVGRSIRMWDVPLRQSATLGDDHETTQERQRANGRLQLGQRKSQQKLVDACDS